MTDTKEAEGLNEELSIDKLEGVSGGVKKMQELKHRVKTGKLPRVNEAGAIESQKGDELYQRMKEQGTLGRE